MLRNIIDKIFHWIFKIKSVKTKTFILCKVIFLDVALPIQKSPWCHALITQCSPGWKCKIHEQMFLNEKQPTEHKFSLSSFPVSICFLTCWQFTCMAEFQSFIFNASPSSLLTRKAKYWFSKDLQNVIIARKRERGNK